MVWTAQVLQERIQHLVVDHVHVCFHKERQHVLVKTKLHVLKADLGQLPALVLGFLALDQQPGYARERHHLGWVVVQGSIYGAVVQSDVDVVIKALGRLQCITLDLCLSRALKDALIGVVASPTNSSMLGS